MPIPFRMYYRAVRRLIWSRYGDIRKPPGPTEEIRVCLKATYGGRIRLMVEGGAFGRAGWIVQTDAELGFVSRVAGQVYSRAIPFEAITETRVERTPWYDYLHIATRGDRVTLRIFKSNRDITQELFNQLQLALAALRAPGDRPLTRAVS